MNHPYLLAVLTVIIISMIISAYLGHYAIEQETKMLDSSGGALVAALAKGAHHSGTGTMPPFTGVPPPGTWPVSSDTPVGTTS